MVFIIFLFNNNNLNSYKKHYVYSYYNNCNIMIFI